MPFITEQVARKPAPAPCMSMVDIAKALDEAVSVVVKHDEDIVAVGGKID